MTVSWTVLLDDDRSLLFVSIIGMMDGLFSQFLPLPTPLLNRIHPPSLPNLHCIYIPVSWTHYIPLPLPNLHCISIPVSWTVLLDDDRTLLFNMMDEFDRLLEINFQFLCRLPFWQRHIVFVMSSKTQHSLKYVSCGSYT